MSRIQPPISKKQAPKNPKLTLLRVISKIIPKSRLDNAFGYSSLGTFQCSRAGTLTYSAKDERAPEDYELIIQAIKDLNKQLNNPKTMPQTGTLLSVLADRSAQRLMSASWCFGVPE